MGRYSKYLVIFVLVVLFFVLLGISFKMGYELFYVGWSWLKVSISQVFGKRFSNTDSEVVYVSSELQGIWFEDDDLWYLMFMLERLDCVEFFESGMAERVVFGWNSEIYSKFYTNLFFCDGGLDYVRLKLVYLFLKLGIVWFLSKLVIPENLIGFLLEDQLFSIVLVFLPEIYLVICLSWFLVLWVVLLKVYSDAFVFRILGLCYVFVFSVVFLLLGSVNFGVVFFGNEFYFMAVTRYCKLLLVFLLLIYGIVCLLWSSERRLWEAWIFCVLIIYACFALFFCVAGDFLIFFITIEGLAYLTYVLIGFGSSYWKGFEAIAKYFVLNGLAGGVMLFGIGILYLVYGTITFFELSLLISLDDSWYLVGLFGFLCILIGLLFKLGIVPFHLWMSDMYYGCSSCVLLFLSTINELVIIFMFVKLLYFFSVFIYAVKFLLFICGCMTFFIGSVAGLVETSIYRLIAYSSITNVGLLFVSYSFLTLQGLVTFIVFFFIYLSLIYLLFIVLFCVGYKYGLDILDMKTVEEGVLVYRFSWVLAFILTVILFSLVGLPPLIGFFSKYIWLVSSVYQVGFLGLVIFLVLFCVGVMYYLRIVRYSIVEDTLENVRITQLYNFLNFKPAYIYIILLGLLYIIFAWYFGYLFVFQLELLLLDDFLFVSI